MEEKPKKSEFVVRVATAKDIKDLNLPGRSNVYTIAICRGKMVGQCRAKICGKKAELWFTYLIHTYRGLGTGHKLIGKMRSFLMKKGIEEIFIKKSDLRKNAGKLYKKAGFKDSKVGLSLKLKNKKRKV